MTSPIALIALADADRAGAGAGGKARGLARLIAAGLPVPGGFALTADAFRAVAGAIEAVTEPVPGELVTIHAIGTMLAALAERAAVAPVPEPLAAAVIARARALGPRLAVRSSLAIEDGAQHAAPGLGTTVLGVGPDDVWAAIRAVWSAAMTPAVIAYARSLGHRDDRAAAAAIAPGVIVQALVAGFRATIYTRPPGRPDDDEVWIGSGEGAPERVARAAPTRWREAIGLAIAAEAAIAAPRGADVELVWGFAARAWMIVQARPLVHPPPRPARRPVPPVLLAPLRAPPRRWRRDVAHNPAPLSLAQAGLCARVEAAAIAPFHLAVVASHLYWAPRDDAPPPPEVADPIAYRDDLAAIEAAIAAILDAPAPPSVDAAIARYLAAYRLLASRLGPLVAAGRDVLPAALAARGSPAAEAARLAPRRPSSVAARLAAAARGELTRDALLAAIGDAAPAWDVAAPTFAETPRRLDDAIARAAARPRPPIDPPIPPGLARAVAIARLAVDAAERDDLHYWRAQAMVRRALLAAAARAGLDPHDVWWLPLDDVARADDAPLDPDVARGRAAAARAAAARAAAWELPLTLDDPPARDDAPPARADAPPARDDAPPPARDGRGAGPRWQGSGVGPHVRGPIHHVDGWSPVPRGAVALARAITPATAVALDGAVAIIAEHGSPLDHGAAMARELGIPCVVGCPGICDALTDGTWVAVDGDRGTVTEI